jgi:hypothetical protein
MTLRPGLFACCLIVLGFAAGPAIAFDECGVGCHATMGGACVRDGWQQGLPVRNECPATSRPTPPCGPSYRWDRRAMMYVER